jgi:alpha-galactosidase
MSDRWVLGRMFGGRIPRAGLLALAACALASLARAQEKPVAVAVTPSGQYSVGEAGAAKPVLVAGVAAKVDGRWLRSADYPRHDVRQNEMRGELGTATEWQVMFSGLTGEPQLVYRLTAFHDAPFAELQVAVENGTGRTIHVESIRVVDATGQDLLDLGGAAAEERVLSDSFSEDRPAMQIHDLADAEHRMHRAVGSQLIYNRESHEGLFLGALTSDRFLTILRMHMGAAKGAHPTIDSYQVDSTGTTEMEKENSLQGSPAEDQIELSLPVPAGGRMESERTLLSVSRDYHRQLETYGELIRKIHRARVSAPPLMGWWSWTAFYFGLNQGAALTNAEWEAQHLKQYGYNVVHIDEGYQYARGEYTTPNAALFPDGMGSLEYRIHGLGLTPGIWTAPFEVSERSWVYQHHPDWLVKNAKGNPIPAGNVVDGKDQLYMLDTTNPGAQGYLRDTYSTMAHQWGIHYVKLDFMDDSAIEGYRYQPNTTAMQAQRIGLAIIRQAVGDDVWLDKDGSAMLNPVGYVDYGRISQDTGDTFEATKEAAPGIAARYYMDRNFFVSDPDAFAVSAQTISDQSWHESRTPATLDESRASIALAAVAGGMFEIGDNLPSLENTPERMKLLEDPDLLDMVHLSRASTPVDLLDYAEADGQPSIFFLKESPRQSILTVFNWTEQEGRHSIPLARLGLAPDAHYRIRPVLDPAAHAELDAGRVQVTVPAHGVRMLKLVNEDVAAAMPVVTVQHADTGKAGETLRFDAAATAAEPVVVWRWEFGDGVTTEGAAVRHTWTEPGDYEVTLNARGIDGRQTRQTFRVRISGYMSTIFNPADIRRPH